MRTTLLSLSLTALLFSIAAPLNAQLTRTWVSGVGSDANSCSRTAPCATFTRAIGQTAAGGQIIALDSGAFGTLTITKAITIDATGVEAIIDTSTDSAGIWVNAGPTDTVVIRGLHIYGPFDGIFFETGAKLIIDNCVIKDMTSPSTAIYLSSSTPSANTFITNTLVSDSSAGIFIGNTAVLDHVTVVNSASNGLYVASDAQVTNSNFSLNFSAGVLVAEHSAVSLESTVISGNGQGLVVSPSGIARLSNVNVWNNTVGFPSAGGILNSFGNNHTTGNLDGVQPTVDNHLAPL